MGRLASGAALRTFAGASVAFLWAHASFAQVPVAGASAGAGTPPPAAPVLPASPPPPPPPPPAAEPTPLPASPPRPSAAEPPPLDPPPAVEAPPSRPTFLHTGAEMERLKAERASRAGRERAPAKSASSTSKLPPDFVLRSSPWVDFTLTSFYMEDRVGNFLNLGVQFGGYVFDRLRVSARMVTPLEDVSDGYSNYGSNLSNGTGTFEQVNARSMSVLYGASVGLLITNSKTFVFGPSVQFQRTDVNAYGSALALGLPFEWTTQRNLRVGFELGFGHAFGGTIHYRCRNFATNAGCGARNVDRPSGTTILFQYSMGWSLGSL
jgi:hypothetical protein